MIYAKFHKNNLSEKVIYIITNKRANYQVTPFRSNDNFSDSTRSLSDGRLCAIIDASMFCLIRLIDEAGRRLDDIRQNMEASIIALKRLSLNERVEF